jgi:hypothetical protein
MERVITNTIKINFDTVIIIYRINHVLRKAYDMLLIKKYHQTSGYRLSWQLLLFSLN